jgi:hypothetical protein
MNRLATLCVLVCLLAVVARADCTLTYEKAKPDFLTGSCFFPINLIGSPLQKTQYWNGYLQNEGGPIIEGFLNWPHTGTGECWGKSTCWPDFFTPQVIYPPGTNTAIFQQRIRSYEVLWLNGPCGVVDDKFDSNVQSCPVVSNSCGSLTFINKCFMYGGDYDFLSCTCSGCDVCGGSPIVVDIDGDGVELTAPAVGVDFDLNGNGTRDRLGWTTANSDDAWLALDRNGNGNIDNGTELFGDYTVQPPGPNKNGFIALSEFDKPSNGGNSDGIIDNQDQIFGQLRLWQDSNHNGVADSGELHPLSSMNVKALELEFKDSKRVDEFGNEFRYRAKVKDSRDGSVARWAWDVFLAHQRHWIK